MTVRRTAPSTESLWRAWVARSNPTVYESSSFAVDPDGPRVLVAEGVAAEPIRVLGRKVHTLQAHGLAEGERWRVLVSLDGTGWSTVGGAPPDHYDAVLAGTSPTGTVTITATGVSPTGVEVVFDEDAPPEAATAEYAGGTLTIGVGLVGCPPLPGALAEWIVDAVNLVPGFAAVASEDTSVVAPPQTVAFDPVGGGGALEIAEDGFTTLTGLYGFVKVEQVGGSPGDASILMASAK